MKRDLSKPGFSKMAHANDGIIHDINNFLGVILGMAEVIKYDIAERYTCQSRADIIIRAAKRCTDLLSGVRFDPSHSDIKRQNFEINPLIGEVAALIRNSGRPVTIIETTNVTERTAVYGHAADIVAALMNVCLNALEAIPDEGTIHLRTRIIDGNNEMQLQKECAVKAAEYILTEISKQQRDIMNALILTPPVL